MERSNGFENSVCGFTRPCIGVETTRWARDNEKNENDAGPVSFFGSLFLSLVQVSEKKKKNYSKLDTQHYIHITLVGYVMKHEENKTVIYHRVVAHFECR